MLKIIIASLGMIIAYVITEILNTDDYVRGLIVMWSYFICLKFYDFIEGKKQ